MIDYYEKGKRDALKDIEAENLNIKTMGRQASWTAVWLKLLKDKYNLKVFYLSGCNISDDEMNYAKGFNEISQFEISKRFGKDVLKETFEQAEKIFEDNYPNIEKFEIENISFQSLVDSNGSAKCPECNESFNTADVENFKEETHLPCNLKIQLLN